MSLVFRKSYYLILLLFLLNFLVGCSNFNVLNSEVKFNNKNVTSVTNVKSDLNYDLDKNESSGINKTKIGDGIVLNNSKKGKGVFLDKNINQSKDEEIVFNNNFSEIGDDSHIGDIIINNQNDSIEEERLSFKEGVVSDSYYNLFYQVHNNITATIFWIGESSSEENNFISNYKSAWDEKWLEHYGGVDGLNIERDKDFFPINFEPKENPYYFALPLNDFEVDGSRKQGLINLIPADDNCRLNDSCSILKNKWIKIENPTNNKVAYAQFEDVGPFGENDVDYVIYGKNPKNKMNKNAGIDLSPAVALYLGLYGEDKVNWQFVEERDVVEGPWKRKITSSQICFYDNCNSDNLIYFENNTFYDEGLDNQSDLRNLTISPYDLDKFRSILNKSKLQAITSSYNPEFGIKYGDFENKSNKYFHLDENNENLIFYMCGKKNRSELRFRNIWEVSTNSEKILNATIRIDNINDDLEEFTFLQIHDDATTENELAINKPLLRIVWRKSYNNIENGIWAIIRKSTNLPNSDYEKLFLGYNYFDFKNYVIKVINSKLFVYINGEKKLERDVSYWEGLENYFKLGVYLQSVGCVRDSFKSIIVIDENDNL